MSSTIQRLRERTFGGENGAPVVSSADYIRDSIPKDPIRAVNVSCVFSVSCFHKNHPGLQLYHDSLPDPRMDLPL